MRTLELGQLDSLLEAVEPGSRDQALILLLVDTGIRIGEAAGLRPEHVSPGRLTVDGKVGTRPVPLSAAVEAALRSHLPWTGQRGELTRSGLQQVVRRAMARAGISGRRSSAHTIRHSFARQYLLAGGDVFSLQWIMGHSRLTTTQTYCDLVDRDVWYQHGRYSPLQGLGRAGRDDFWGDVPHKNGGDPVMACPWGKAWCHQPQGEICPVIGAAVWEADSQRRKARDCPWAVTKASTVSATVATRRRGQVLDGAGRHNV
jgi:hypothetical protein